MDLRLYWTCLWPGLSELWWRGRLSSLPLAIGFAIALNALLMLKYFYPTWLDPLLVRSAFWVGWVAWICWTIKSARELPNLIDPRSAADEPDHFVEAHAAYLQSDWQTAEALLMRMLAIEARDPPALLLLSGLYRHTSRPQHAAAIIAELRRLEIADRWQIEIDAEASRIDRDLDSDRPDNEAASAASNESEAAELTAA